MTGGAAPVPPTDGAAPTATIVEGLAAAARRAPHAAALYLPDGPGGRGAAGWRAVTNSQLWRRAHAVAGGLVAVGAGPGDRVVLLVPPSTDLFAAAFGLLAAGMVPVLIDPGIGAAHLRRCLQEADAAAFIGTPKAQVASALLRWTPGVRHRVVAGAPRTTALTAVMRRGSQRRAGSATRWPKLNTLAAVERSAAHAAVPGPADGTAAVLFTSGSTGPPKGVVYTHVTFSGQVDALRQLYGLGPHDVQVATFPPFALFGPALGMPTVIPRMDPTRPAEADPAHILEAVTAFDASVLFASPALLDAVSAWAEARRLTLPGVRLVMSAGAPVSLRIVRATAAVLEPDARLVTPYGATEALPVASVDHTELLEVVGSDGEPPFGVCVGRPAPGVRVGIMRLTDDARAHLTDEDLLPPGQVGEIVVSGRQVTASYFRRPAATAAAKTHWDGAPAHRMGDAGYVDPDGRLWFCGRVAHIVHTESGPLAPVPLEVVFNAHPEVARAAVIGIGPRGRQQVCVCIERAPDADADLSDEALVARLCDLAQAHRRTSDVDEIRVHPGFPVDIRHNAKIDYGALRRWWLSG